MKIYQTNISSRLTWAIAWIFLAGVLCYYNGPSAVKAVRTPAAAESEEAATEIVLEEDDTPIGKEVGERCPTFTAELYNDLGTFDLADHLGKVVVLNFWATWCTPCVNELPYFQQIHETYPDTVSVIALHSNLVTDDVQAYLDKQEYTLPFGLDADGSIIKSLGGSTMLPMTVILDQKGHIVYNAVGSVTYEKLESLILPLLEN